MSKINCTIELSESDIKCAICRYIAEQYGIGGFTHDIRNVELNHREDTTLWSDGFVKPITVYGATFEIKSE